MTRGEVWWAELAGEAGIRPVVIVSRSESVGRRSGVCIAENTRVVRALPSEAPLSKADGMPTDCVINAENINTIPKEALRRRITVLSARKLFALSSALRLARALE